jgi:hypothetical protein
VLAANAAAARSSLLMPLAESLVLTVGANTTHPGQTPEHDERDHRPHHDDRESGFPNGHGSSDLTNKPCDAAAIQPLRQGGPLRWMPLATLFVRMPRNNEVSPVCRPPPAQITRIVTRDCNWGNNILFIHLTWRSASQDANRCNAVLSDKLNPQKVHQAFERDSEGRNKNNAAGISSRLLPSCIP